MMIEKPLPKRRLTIKALFIALLLAFLLTGVVHAVVQNRKLSGEMIDQGDVVDFEISPDGEHIVFLADARTDGQYELFSVPTIGVTPVLLSSGLSDFDGVVYFLISPDSQHVVYSVGSGGINPDQLFSVPIGGGSPVELFHTDGVNYYLSDVKITPDSSRVLFREINEDIRRDFLYRVSIGGGAVNDIYAPEDFCYIDYKITPDSQNVIFSVSETGCDYQGFFQSSLIVDDIPIWLDDKYVEEFKITPDSEYVVFTQETTDADSELFSIPVGGGTQEKLNGTLTPGGRVSSDFQLTNDSEYVVYMADEFILGMDLLYRAPVDGSELRLNLTPWAMVANGDVTSFQISPDSQWIVYRADQQEDDKFDLYSVLISGGIFNKLSTGMIAEGDIIEFQYKIVPNSEGVVLIADYYTDFVNELFAVNMTGTWGTRLNVDLPSNGDVIDFRISYNSQGVVFRADQETDEVFSLYLVPSIGGAVPVQINPDLVDGGDVGNPLYLFPFDITPDDKGIVYIADQEVNEEDELFITYDYDYKMVYLPMVVK
jgi:Tol biopolymer transport system component